jgi:gluconolactonase
MSELTVVAEGLRFPEGPIAMPDGSVLLVELLNFLDRAYAS